MSSPVLADSGCCRCVQLRAVSMDPDGPRALVALSADQWLRLPVALQDMPAWRNRIGQHVWVDVAHARLFAHAPVGARHA
jgi:hypothetical protein